MSTENERGFDDFAISIANLLDDAVAVIKDLKQNLSTGGEYCICRDDGKEMGLSEKRHLKATFERGDALIRNAKEREIPCKHCHGTGTVYLEGSIHGEDVCPKCHGTRLIGYDDCSGADCQDCGHFISEDEMRCRNESHT